MYEMSLLDGDRLLPEAFLNIMCTALNRDIFAGQEYYVQRDVMQPACVIYTEAKAGCMC